MFFKSLRVRIISSLVLIVLITLSIAGLTLYATFRGYQEDLTAASLKQIASPIYYNLTAPSAFTNTQRGGQRLRQELLEYIRVQKQETGVIILAVGSDGHVINDFAPDTDAFSGETFEIPPPPARGPNFSELSTGEYSTTDGDQLLFVTVPMPQTVRSQEAGINAVVVALPASAGPNVYADLRQRLIFSGMIGLIAAMLAGFLLWLSVYRPLGKVTAGIRAVSRGDYNERVPETGPTEVRTLARDVNAMATSVQASQRTLREFLANVSHELKTPLTSIRGFSQAMIDGTLETPDERARAARVIEAESKRVLHLVGELMDLSRLETGQQRMDLAPVSAAELLRHAAEVFALRGEEQDVALEMTVPPEDLLVAADFERIEQVLGNLIDNAFRHSPAGGAVHITASTNKDGLVEFTVRDEGSGIAADDLPHVFDRFYRSADETAGSGAGLGLAISREIVRAHGGEIRASSHGSDGSVFSFTVPVTQTLPRPRLAPTVPPRVGEANG